MRKKWTFFVAVLSVLCSGVNSLFCYRCLTLDCPEDDLNCRSIRTFIQFELKHLYYFNDDLPFCPEPDDGVGWRHLQIMEEPCEELRPREATCTLGRLKITTTETGSNGVSTKQVNYGTLLGCATRQLLLRIKNAAMHKRCDAGRANSSISDPSGSYDFELEIEHCSELDRECYQNDFCINHKISGIDKKPFKEEDTPTTPSPPSKAEINRTSLTVAVIVACVVLSVVILLIFIVDCFVRSIPDQRFMKVKGFAGPSEAVLATDTSALSAVLVSHNREAREEKPDPPPRPQRLGRVRES